MSNQPDDIIFLWRQFAEKKAGKEQIDRLFDYLKETAYDEESLTFLEQQFAEHKVLKRMDEGYLAERLDKILRADIESEASDLVPSTYPRPIIQRVQFLQTTWFRYAAIVLVLLGTGIYFWNLPDINSKGEILKPDTHLFTQIKPGTNRATLTLSDGSTIILDSAAIGNLAEQGNTNIVNQGAGSLTYQASYKSGSDLGKEMLYNTIVTPRGGQYKIILSDGTAVWLNSLSSIRFPVAFNTDFRKIQITGEAYIEVAKDPQKPFYVTASNVEVDVLGTSFNINAYSDEAFIRTTLLEGSIRTGSTKVDKVILKPGEQALTPHSGSGVTIQKGNTTEAIAWKNGYFYFNNSDIKDVMRQLSRWYDVEIQFDGNLPDNLFLGKIYRQTPLSKVLDILAFGGGGRFTIEGNKITVRKR